MGTKPFGNENGRGDPRHCPASSGNRDKRPARQASLFPIAAETDAIDPDRLAPGATGARRAIFWLTFA